MSNTTQEQPTTLFEKLKSKYTSHRRQIGAIGVATAVAVTTTSACTDSPEESIATQTITVEAEPTVNDSEITTNDLESTPTISEETTNAPEAITEIESIGDGDQSNDAENASDVIEYATEGNVDEADEQLVLIDDPELLEATEAELDEAESDLAIELAAEGDFTDSDAVRSRIEDPALIEKTNEAFDKSIDDWMAYYKADNRQGKIDALKEELLEIREQYDSK